MPQAHTAKQKHQALHIKKSYTDKDVPEEEAQRRAWATVNKISNKKRKKVEK